MLSDNVPVLYQRHGGFDREEAAKVAESMGVTVEQLMSSQDNTLPIADIAPKFVYGADLVSKERLHKLPTHMRNLHEWYLDFCKRQRDQLYIRASILQEYFFRREDLPIEICELWQLFNLDALDKSLMSCYCV